MSLCKISIYKVRIWAQLRIDVMNSGRFSQTGHEESGRNEKNPPKKQGEIWIQNNKIFNRRIGESRNSCSVGVEDVGVEGMMNLDKGGVVGTGVRLDERIACMALQMLPPDLEVLPLASARCDPIRSFEGRSAKWWTSFVSKPVWIPSKPNIMYTHSLHYILCKYTVCTTFCVIRSQCTECSAGIIRVYMKQYIQHENTVECIHCGMQWAFFMKTPKFAARIQATVCTQPNVIVCLCFYAWVHVSVCACVCVTHTVWWWLLLLSLLEK